MSTTTIRLPDSLKDRVAVAAERAGTSAHSFILEAIAEKTERDEQRTEFLASAEERYARIIDSGKAVPWAEMRGYMARRLGGEQAPPPPKPRKLGR